MEISINKETGEGDPNNSHSLEGTSYLDVFANVNNSEDIKEETDLDKLSDENIVETMKEEFNSDKLSEVGSIKIEEYDLKYFVPSFKMAKGEDVRKSGLEENEIYQCSSCNFRTSYQSSLILHANIHKNKKSLMFPQIGNVTRYHMISTSEKRFKCYVCDFSCMHDAILKAHVLSHANPKPFKCNLCEYSSCWKDDLKDHYSSVHSGKRYKCSKCGRTFVYKYALKYHQVIHRRKAFFK